MNHTVKEIIKERRERLGLTQIDIAKAVGVQSGDFISLVEKGVRNLDLDRIPRLANILEVDPVDLSQLALEEQYPLLAQCLVGRTVRSKTVGMSESNMATKRLEELPRHVRQMVINMINVLFEKEVKVTSRIRTAA
jgi:transcriptional regulator with XRE-family HTH domain